MADDGLGNDEAVQGKEVVESLAAAIIGLLSGRRK